MEEKIYYDSDNNVKLCGILNKASNGRVVIMCHGIRGNKEECGSFTYLSERLQKEGYSSFRFDFNGHGESIKYGNLFTEENKKVAQNDGFYITKSMNSGKEFKFGLELFNEVDKYKPYKELRKCDLPKLFVHGEIDSAVPYKLSKEVAEMCNNAKFEPIENGEHTCQNSKEAIENAINVTMNFIKEIL